MCNGSGALLETRAVRGMAAPMIQRWLEENESRDLQQVDEQEGRVRRSKDEDQAPEQRRQQDQQPRGRPENDREDEKEDDDYDNKDRDDEDDVEEDEDDNDEDDEDDVDDDDDDEDDDDDDDEDDEDAPSDLRHDGTTVTSDAASSIMAPAEEVEVLENFRCVQ